MIETVRLSQRAKEQLITLKRKTKIQNWNILCRWGLCLSLAKKDLPTIKDVHTDGSIEMTWKVFGGRHSGIYLALLKEKCRAYDIACTPQNVNAILKHHLHRGISYLSAENIESASDLINLSTGDIK